jgi:hypothetical protein
VGRGGREEIVRWMEATRKNEEGEVTISRRTKASRWENEGKKEEKEAVQKKRKRSQYNTWLGRLRRRRTSSSHHFAAPSTFLDPPPPRGAS